MNVAEGKQAQSEATVESVQLSVAATQSAVEKIHLEVAKLVSSAAGGAPAPATGAPVFDPWSGQSLGQARAPTRHFNVGSPGREPEGEAPLSGSGNKWRLYEERWVLSGEGKYNSAKPLAWLKDLRNYVAGMECHATVSYLVVGGG